MKIFTTYLLITISLTSVLYGETCKNGLYIDNDYIAKNKPKRFYTSLTNKIKSNNIRDLYIKVYPQQRKLTKNIKFFLKEIKSISNDIKIHGWTGKRVCTKKRKKLCFNLNNKKQIKHLKLHSQKLWELGFDAVHLNLEPIDDGNTQFTTIIKSINSLKPKNKLLSIASYMIKPDEAHKHLINKKKNVYFWSKSYLQKILKNVDHIMVMAYDTALNKKEDYIQLLKFQADSITSITKNSKVEVRLGLPSFDFGRTGFFNSNIETLENALTGVKKSFKKGCPKNIGITIYNDSETTQLEWRFFQSLLIDN